MTLSQLLILITLALLTTILSPSRRAWVWFVISLIAVYLLQPPLNIRWLNFSLATLTLVIATLGWLLTRSQPRQRPSRQDFLTLTLMLCVSLGMALTRDLNLPFELISRPPPLIAVSAALALALGISFALARWRFRLSFALGASLIAFIWLKSPELNAALASWLRSQAGQDPTLPSGIEWLGFSYIAFRLIHTLRDRQAGILPDVSLRVYVTYLLFAPTLVAGPIDRLERFAGDCVTLAPHIKEGLGRIALGLAKKFVVADSLALIALDAVRAEQAQSAAWLWVMVYAYGVRLWLDFAGYSDIAIGLGRIIGVQLPENFMNPYAQTNLREFWRRWHATLSAWVQTYIFLPLNRTLLRREPRPAMWVITLVGQSVTMLVIGLWHGITLPFVIWGLWHGMGLFVHKQWSDQTRLWYRRLQTQPRRREAWRMLTWCLSLHYVLLGWLWFSLPTMEVAIRTMGRLFGIGW